MLPPTEDGGGMMFVGHLSSQPSVVSSSINAHVARHGISLLSARF